jgi:glycosyltransferase involved in cell wall biosynthesis
MKKIGFVCLAGLDQFIDQIIEGLSDNYIVRKFIIRTQQEIYNAIDWADIVWFEWCNQTAIMGTNYEGIKGKKVIVRLHSYEIFTDFPKQINWTVVDKLILVAPHIKEILKIFIPDIEKKVKIEIVSNGIDLDSTHLKETQPGHNIAWVGFINYKKNPQMALQILKKLTEGLYNTDKRYMLHVAGSFQDSRYKIYLEYMIKEMGLQDNVKFYGWIDDMQGFWEDKNYLLHTSIHESFGYGIFEAMARGIKPVIHNFRGAKELYPKYAIFNTIDGAADIITNENYYSNAYRNWIIDKGWTLKNQLKQIKDIIKGD